MKTNNPNKSLIVVFGDGRSGTSLTMQILQSFGMAVSKDMIPPKEQNPDGAYEDTEIFRAQESLQRKITPPGMPLFSGWMENANTIQTFTHLKQIVESRIENTSEIWGFKDQRTTLFIPMWTRIFNSVEIVPKYILAVRNPAQVISSKKRQYNINEEVSELTWLTRNTEALHHSGANCFILQYEDWLDHKKAVMVAKKLLEFTELNSQPDTKDINEALKGIIKPSLNRAIYDDYEIKNRYIHLLYKQLSQCRGYNFDREKLMRAVKECRQGIAEFSRWALVGQRYMHRVKNEQKSQKALKEAIEKLRIRISVNNEEHAKRQQALEGQIKVLKVDLEKSVIESNSYLKECKDLHDELENLRIQISVQNKKHANLQKKNKILNQNITRLKQSRGYNFDREKLMRAVKECRQGIAEFSRWALVGQRYMHRVKNEQKSQKALKEAIEKLRIRISVNNEEHTKQKEIIESLRNRISVNNEEHAKRQQALEGQIKVLKVDLEKSVIESNSYLKECKDLHDELENLRIQISVQNKKHANLQKKNKILNQNITRLKQSNKKSATRNEYLKKDKFDLRTSTSFRLGNMLVLSISKPGKNTLLLPFRLLRIMFGARTVNYKKN